MKVTFSNDIEGYYFMSGSNGPVVVRVGDALPWKTTDDLPKVADYVVAAFFCRMVDGKPVSSIHVRFVDGRYECAERELPEGEACVFEGVSGLPSLMFIQTWETEVRGGFETYVPGQALFAGFVKA